MPVSSPPSPPPPTITRTATHRAVDVFGEARLMWMSQRKLNGLALPLAYVDRHQRLRFANQAFLDWVGRRHDEVIGRLVLDVLGREIEHFCRAAMDAALRGERAGLERELAPLGRPIAWIRIDFHPDRSSNGDVRGFLATFANVDEHKTRELAAVQRERRLRLVADHAGSPIAYFDRQLRLRFANRPFAAWFGTVGGDLLNRPVHEVLPAESLAEMRGYLERAFAGASVTYERRDRRGAEAPRWVRVTLFPDREPGGRVGGVFAVLTDIDGDVRLRQALRAQDARLRLFADNVAGPVAYLDAGLRYTFVNQAFANWVCRPQDEVQGRTPADVMPAEVTAFLLPLLARAHGGEPVDYERLATDAGGEPRWMHGRIVPDLDAAGMVLGLLCTEYDIHDLKSTEQALAAREEQLRLFTDNIPEPVVYLDAERRYAFVNEAFLRLTGLTREAVLGRLPEEVGETEASRALAVHHARALTGEPTTHEGAFVDAAGRRRWIRARMVPDFRFDGAVKGVYVVGHDITDLKQAQDTLAARESQLRAIMDGVPAPVAYIDEDQRCQYVNRTLLQFFGLRAADVTSMRLRDIVGDEIYESAKPKIGRAFGGEAAAFDRLVTGAVGVRRWMTIRIVPDMTPTGLVHGAFVLMNDIHGLKQAQEALRASEAELRRIMDNVPARVAYIDRDYRCRFVNRRIAEWLGRGQAEFAGRPILEIAGPARYAELEPLFARVLAGELVAEERPLPQPNGGERWESIHYAPNLDADGNVIGIYAVHTDIHDAKRNEEELRRANWMLSSHMNNTPLAVLEWDRDFRLVRWSPQAENIFGWSAEHMLGMPIDGNPLLHETDREAVTEMLRSLTSGEEPRATGLTRNYRKDGNTIWCEWYHSCLLDEQGGIVSILSFVQDVSSRIQAEERLQHMATRDALTGLPNRLLLYDRLNQAIAAAKRSGRRVGVLFIDLDRFKNVNDTLGHRIGDELLKHVTRALLGATRGSDLLARLGGDEFMVIVEDFDDPAVLARIAQKLQDAVSQPFRVENHEIHVTSSIGISVYPDDSVDPEELLMHADVAMYRSKELGRNTFQYLDAELAQRRLKQHSLEAALRAALREERLRLHYQPIVRLADGAVVGAEALLRWNDPEHGSVSPQVFIPLAEESGLIHALGDWVVRSAAEQCVAWRAAGLELPVSVNLSARQLSREDLALRVSAIVRGAGCDPAWIELEVTETGLLHDIDGTRRALERLRAEGFTVAIDDFGTGYSSLAHLKHFPIDTLKIDISFIADLETDRGDAAITEAIIALARGLGLKTVAEGVGTPGQLEFLTQRGCHHIQGFLVSEPLAADRLERFVRDGCRLP
jgi:diguanylate cyclase (GGDEF)-like protein/PAS domain S-box-containing protein